MDIVLYLESLNILGLDINKIRMLSEVEQAENVKEAWKKKRIQTHPDKGGNAADFIRVDEAYKALTTSPREKNQYDIISFCTSLIIDIPTTAIDLSMQEGIFEVFADLKKQFRALESEQEKRAFANYYDSFLTLAQSLEDRRRELTKVRGEVLYHQEVIEHLGAFLEREWRILIIHLFAEEYLDDFQYRNALAFGGLLPILTARKLLSPVKWLAAIVGGMDLLLRGSAEYFQTRNKYLSTFLNFIGAPLSIINYIVDLIASPVNNVVRPFAAYTGLPPAAITALLTGIGVSIIYELITASIAFSLTSAMLILPYLTLALNIYSIYTTYQVYQHFKQKGAVDDANQFGLLFGLSILMNFIPSVPIYDLCSVVVQVCTLNSIKKSYEDSPIENLPLPKSPVPEDVIQATLLGYKRANQSHRFFGTPKDADFQRERTIWQKTAGFFGVDRANPKEPAPRFKTPLAI